MQWASVSVQLSGFETLNIGYSIPLEISSKQMSLLLNSLHGGLGDYSWLGMIMGPGESTEL